MTETVPPSRPTADDRRSRFRPILVLVACFLLVSAAMEAVLIAQSAGGGAVDTAIWIRCSLVLGSAVVLLIITARAASGSRNAWIRVRIISIVVFVAVIVIVSIPGFLPDWVRIEQGVCGAIVLPAAILLNLPHVGALFPAASSDRGA